MGLPLLSCASSRSHHPRQNKHVHIWCHPLVCSGSADHCVVKYEDDSLWRQVSHDSPIPTRAKGSIRELIGSI